MRPSDPPWKPKKKHKKKGKRGGRPGHEGKTRELLPEEEAGQSERGNLFVERMMTVSATCKQQDRNAIDYVTDAVRARLIGAPCALPPAGRLIGRDDLSNQAT